MSHESPDLKFIGTISFVPTEIDEYDRDEYWTYETTTAHGGYDDKGREIFTVTMHLTRPKKCIASRGNAHP